MTKQTKKTMTVRGLTFYRHSAPENGVYGRWSTTSYGYGGTTVYQSKTCWHIESPTDHHRTLRAKTPEELLAKAHALLAKKAEAMMRKADKEYGAE